MHGREGEMGSPDQAGLLGGHGLGKEGHWIFSTQERDVCRTSHFYVAYKGGCWGVKSLEKHIQSIQM